MMLPSLSPHKRSGIRPGFVYAFQMKKPMWHDSFSNILPILKSRKEKNIEKYEKAARNQVDKNDTTPEIQWLNVYRSFLTLPEKDHEIGVNCYIVNPFQETNITNRVELPFGCWRII